jgi:hypothetical protein
MAIEKNQNSGGRFGALPIWSIWLNFEVNGLDWHCCLAPKRAPGFSFLQFIFSIVLGAEYSSYVKSIGTYDPTLLGYNNSVLAIV